MLHVYTDPSRKVNISCGTKWICEVWKQKGPDLESTGTLVDMNVRNWLDSHGRIRNQAIVPPDVKTWCCDPEDMAFAWCEDGRSRGTVLKEEALRAWIPNPELTIDEIYVEEGMKLNNLDSLTATILHEATHLIDVYGRKESDRALRSKPAVVHHRDLY